ncbi:DUF6804 family protein [Humibacter ginsenosidimutans]|uniref:DUF6804 family protein n=1 Tax=Humibacter ginsenosidimutans TaxID=2599293 RepID=UPI001AF01A8E|nr:DUF6804 family protein [Humibacter ginsenosidimutans]
MSRPAAQPTYARLALLPGILGGIVLLASFALIGNSAWYIWVRFIVAILALIMCVFAVQGKSYWWLIGLVPVAVVFNPVWPLPIDDLWMRLLTLASTVVMIAAGVAIKVPVGEEKAGPQGRYGGRKAGSRGTQSAGSGRGRSKG